MKNSNIQNWHYYIDVQKKGQKYLNIVDCDRDKLIQVKNKIEFGMNIMNWIFILTFLSIFVFILTSFVLKYKIPRHVCYIMLIIIILYSTRLINPYRYFSNYEF